MCKEVRDRRACLMSEYMLGGDEDQGMCVTDRRNSCLMARSGRTSLIARCRLLFGASESAV
jgi:hypothetical protein